MEPELMIELSINVGETKIPFTISVRRKSLEEFVAAIAESAASSVSLLDLLRKDRGR